MKLTTIVLLVIGFFGTTLYLERPALTGEESVQEILEELSGVPSINRPNEKFNQSSAEKGKEIVELGLTRDLNGKYTQRQSKHFVCTSCHNTTRENYDLTKSDPEDRLLYAEEYDLPYLQATTFYGISSRTEFYNGDYYKKYGTMVYEARNDIRKAIQLCATECAQGRPMEDWEIESVMMYFWSLDYKLNDLALELHDLDKLEFALNNDSGKLEAIKALENTYLHNSPATFTDPPVPRKTGRPEIDGFPENGKIIYERSCLHCHQNNRYSFFELDNDEMSFKFLARNMKKYTVPSVYQVVRYGTEPVPGKRAYMPHFTEEKMSFQQMEDLRAYIMQRAGKEI